MGINPFHILRMASNQIQQYQERGLVAQPQVMPVQPIAVYSAQPQSSTTVLQPIVIPQSSNNSLDGGQTASKQEARQESKGNELTVATARLGDL